MFSLVLCLLLVNRRIWLALVIGSALRIVGLFEGDEMEGGGNSLSGLIPIATFSSFNYAVIAEIWNQQTDGRKERHTPSIAWTGNITETNVPAS